MGVDKKIWDATVAKHAPVTGGFLQAWAWGDVEKASGHVVERILDESKDGLLLAQCVENTLPWPGPLKRLLPSSYVFIPRGPLGTRPIDVSVATLQKHFSGKAAFLKVETSVAPSAGQLVGHRHPEVTRLLDLGLGFAELEKGFKPKTRYNMKLAERKGVTVRVGGLELLPDFMALVAQTTKRGGFSEHEEGRFVAILEHANDDTVQSFLAVAEFDGEVIAANLMIDAFGVRTYLHGASGNRHREVMAPFVLHGWLIRDAIAKGLSSYDFWGIAPPGSGDSHPWAGITRFKDGFGGTLVTMPGTFDIAINAPATSLYHFLRGIRPAVRKLLGR